MYSFSQTFWPPHGRNPINPTETNLVCTSSTSRKWMLIQVTILLALLRRIWLLAPCSALAIAMITIDPISTSFWIRVTISVIAKPLLDNLGTATFVAILTFKNSLWTEVENMGWKLFSMKSWWLTPNTPLIHTSFTYSKWNMGEIFGLNCHLSYLHAPQNFFLKSLHAQKRSFLLLNL